MVEAKLCASLLGTPVAFHQRLWEHIEQGAGGRVARVFQQPVVALGGGNYGQTGFYQI